MKTANDLEQLLRQIDHKGYPAYKQTAGQWRMKGFILSIDHVQGDPFASPSSVSVIIDAATHGFPEDYYENKHRKVVLEDYLLRHFGRALDKADISHAGSGKSGLLFTSHPGQEILERTAMTVDPMEKTITARFFVGFPAKGRTISAEPLIRILFDVLPRVIRQELNYANVDHKSLEKAIWLSDDQYALRLALSEKGLQAFVANGSILPRESGVSQRPMKGAVAFQSPDTLEATLDLPHYGTITGMGIPDGIFLIIGGGYHGKSTLLAALERGVYDHISGDGREFVVTRHDAMKIRAEDGRSVQSVDVSLFINDLPNKKDTVAFVTADASGSTSQAANVAEAMEAGSTVLLIDEDTCATNFMVRDELMRRVVSDREESITPFLFRMRDLYEKEGVSVILVAGSSGSFFEVADTVIQMDAYRPKDVTARAKEIWNAKGTGESTKPLHDFHAIRIRRIPQKVREWSNPSFRVKTKVLGIDSFSINKETVELRGLEQLVDKEQTTALAMALKIMGERYFDGKRSVREACDLLYKQLEEKGVAMLAGKTVSCGLALPRREELIAAINRWRGLRVMVEK